MPTLHFPKGFLWGASTASHQVEGHTENNWSEWEKQNAERLAQESESKYGRLENWPTIRAAAQNPNNYLSGNACEHYERFREDFDIARALNHNAHRFSIEWSRIEPEEGKFDEAAIEHYRQVLIALRERGIEPFVTLWHWTHPLWLEKKGGMESRHFVQAFERYARYVVASLQEHATFWMTINEPTSVIGNCYVRGIWPPQKKSWLRALLVYYRLARAHRRGYHAIHDAVPRAKVGFGNLLHSFEPYHRHSWLDELGIAVARFFSNRLMLYLTRGHHDYLSVQYYFHDRIKFVQKIPRGDMPKNDIGWDIYPKGIYNVIDYLKGYKLPIYITENGLADANDSKRKKFLDDHLAWIHRAISEGADVRGYFHWSLLDNFEWDKGFWPRFGLVEVDYATQKRSIRPSARYYADIVKANALMVDVDPTVK